MTDAPGLGRAGVERLLAYTEWANRATFHRGQVVAMLRQLGVAPPATDLVAWDRGA